MNLADIKSLYAYNRWANDRLFAAVEKVPDENFSAPIVSSFPSLRETAFHILFAEWLWLNRWQGVSPCTTVVDPNASAATWDTLSPGKKPTWAELSNATALKSFAESTDQERQEFIGTLDERALQAVLQYKGMDGNPYAGPLVQLMQHVVNHGTYHRGQVTMMLRQLGAEAVGLDMVYFYRERAGR
jgi:uncharacterized damage-inducible protein DinB